MGRGEARACKNSGRKINRRLSKSKIIFGQFHAIRSKKIAVLSAFSTFQLARKNLTATQTAGPSKSVAMLLVSTRTSSTGVRK